MRFFEFANDEADDSLEKFIVVLRNFIGRAASKKAPVKLNWNALGRISTASGIELAADYETFKSMYDSSPALQALVKNFNDDGIELKVPGAPDAEPSGDGAKTPQDSQAAVDQTAASAAAGQLAASQTTPQA
jgi:hypothetical protein